MTTQRICLSLSLIVMMASCKKDTPAGNDPNDPKDSTTVNVVGKKGADFSTNTSNGTWNDDIVNLKAHWFYTWGTPLPNGAPQNCEFVSMFWGKGNVTDGNIAAVKQLKDQGKVKYVLGFNEPDMGDQSNMSVADALALWPKLESIGLPLGSPATSWPTNQWITDFMDSAIKQHRRVDFICVHMYVGTDDKSFVQVLQDVYNKYHLPIWVTEFATADWGAASPGANHYTAEQALGFMQRLLPQLESLSFVQRYSWFSGDPKSSALWPSALVDANGQLTTMGAWYAAYKPNAAVKR